MCSRQFKSLRINRTTKNLRRAACLLSCLPACLPMPAATKVYFRLPLLLAASCCCCLLLLAAAACLLLLLILLTVMMMRVMALLPTAGCLSELRRASASITGLGSPPWMLKLNVLCAACLTISNLCKLRPRTLILKKKRKHCLQYFVSQCFQICSQ